MLLCIVKYCVCCGVAGKSTRTLPSACEFQLRWRLCICYIDLVRFQQIIVLCKAATAWCVSMNVRWPQSQSLLILVLLFYMWCMCITCAVEAETKNHLNLKFILWFITWCQTKSLTVTCQRLVPDRQLISHMLVLLVFRLTIRIALLFSNVLCYRCRMQLNVAFIRVCCFVFVFINALSQLLTRNKPDSSFWLHLLYNTICSLICVKSAAQNTLKIHASYS